MNRPLLVLFAAVTLAAPLSAETKDEGPRKAFLPGLAASLIQNVDGERWYPGAAFHYAFVEGISRSRDSWDFGGYYEWYSEIGVFQEYRSSLTRDVFFTLASGVNLSFEKFLGGSRDFLIPYFGAKGGGVFYQQGAGGFFVEPILGLVLLENRSVVVNYDVGLFLNTAELARRIGLHQSLLVNFNL